MQVFVTVVFLPQRIIDSSSAMDNASSGSSGTKSVSF